MKFKKLLSLAAAAAVSVSALPSVFADSYSDIGGHWSEAAISRLSENGIIQGSDGKIRPEDYISRAELATVLYNTMGGDGIAAESTEYSQTGTGGQWVSSALSDGSADAASFSDFDADKWYASALKWAVGAGIITGYEGNTIKPENPVTRQEAVVIIQRGCGIDGGGEITAGDADEVSDWAKDAVGGFMANGFLNGDDGGMVNPTANIKRGELFTLLNNIIGEFINNSGEYNYIDCGNKLVIVKSGSVVIKNAKCGKIIIGADADEPEIDDVSVKVKVYGKKKIKVSTAGNSNSGNSSIISGGGSSSSGGGGGSSSSSSSTKVRLTLNANGGVFSDGSERQTISCLKGVTVRRKIEEEPTREGYVFKGWYTTADRADKAGDNYYDTDNKLTNALSLYAGWVTSENPYTITAAPMTDPSEPDEEQVKNYKVTTDYDKGTVTITGSELKQFRYDSKSGKKTWAGIEIEMSNVVFDALENDETLRYYAGEKRRSGNGGWTGHIEDIKKGSDTLLFYFDVSEEPQIKYIEFELPDDMNDQSVEFKLDLTKLTLYEYKPEPAESEGVSIAKPQADEHGLMSADFKLDADKVKPHTLVATGTLNYVTDYPEEGQSGNYMLLDITLGSDATNAATVKIGDEVVTINEKTGTVLIKVDSETGDLVITVDYDGEGEDFKATDYTVVTGLLVLAPSPDEGKDPGENPSENVPV